MKKKKITVIILSMLLSISLLTNLNQLYHKKQLEKEIELTLIESLGFAASSFALDYENVEDEKMKLYYYNRGMIQVAMASKVAKYINFKENDGGFSVSLYHLAEMMSDETYKDKIIKYHFELYEVLEQLQRNPNNLELQTRLQELIHKHIRN